MSINDFFQEKILRFHVIKTKLVPEIDRNILHLKQNYDKDMDKFMRKEKVKELLLKRRNLMTEEMDYFYKNHLILEKYFVELKKIENDANKKKDTNSFFNKFPTTEIIETSNNEYLKKNGKLLLNDYNENICKNCIKNSMILSDDNQLICSLCFNTDIYIKNDLPNHMNLYNNNTTCYIRLNHFRRIILNFNGIATMTIPQIIISKIETRLKKDRIDITQLDFMIMKKIIKRMGLPQYNDQVNYFIRCIRNDHNNEYAIDETTSNKMNSMFLELQCQFNQICPSNRHNFFGYRFILGQFLLLLNKHEILSKSKILMTMKKNVVQDRLFLQCINKMDIKRIVE